MRFAVVSNVEIHSVMKRGSSQRPVGLIWNRHSAPVDDPESVNEQTKTPDTFVSHPNLRTVLERGASDVAFREQLLADPNSALAAYTLAADEATLIRSLSQQQLEKLATDMSALDGELSEELLERVAGGGRHTTTCIGRE